MKFLKVWFMLCFGVFISSIPVFAAESQFAYNYTTDLLPKGQKEIEQWFTWRHAKDQGKFDVWEGRTAFEYGVTDNFQAAFYLNYLKNKSYHNGIDGTTAPAEATPPSPRGSPAEDARPHGPPALNTVPHALNEETQAWTSD